MKDDISVVMGNIWYDIIKNGEVVTNYYNKRIAIKRAKEIEADYVVKVVDFEPLEVIWEAEQWNMKKWWFYYLRV